MLLAIDVGNTNMVFAIYRGKELVGSFRLMTDENRTSDEIGLTIYNYFQLSGLKMTDVEDVIIASVAPQVMYTLTSAMVRYFGRKPIVIDDDVDPGLLYNGEDRLGADRSVACVAAIEKYGAPLVVLDFGTATTVDAVEPGYRYLGGCITTGLRVVADALVKKAALLTKVELALPPDVVSLSTTGQIQAGIVGGYVGAIEYLVRRTKQEMPNGDKARVVATGGLVRLISDNSDVIDIVDGQLIMDGLRIIYERYKQSSGN